MDFVPNTPKEKSELYLLIIKTIKMAEKYFKAESKKDWYTSVGITNEDLQTGALMRIADATEVMAKNFLQLQKDKELYQRWYNEEKQAKEAAYRRNIALRGHITRLKKNQGV